MNDLSDKADCHELQLLATNGQRFRVDLRTAVQIVLSPLYLWSLAPFALMGALFESPLPGTELGYVARAGLWMADCALTTGYWIAIFAALSLATRHRPIIRAVPQALICCVAITAMVWTNQLFAPLFGEPASAATIWLQALRYSAIAVLFELTSVVFLLPRFEGVTMLTDGPPGAPPSVPSVTAPQAEPATLRPPAPRPAPLLRVNDLTIPVGSLLSLRSVEHYVEIATTDQTFIERAPLRDLVAQLEAANGIQCHRSHWVSREAVRGLSRRGGNVVLELVGGAEIPVSRGRRQEVEAWLNAAPVARAANDMHRAV
ncbi:LytTR family DNA-binding domain-containing protein [Mesobacterium pallidum]|uniref:LytTR family DNA-binding domain-containing protein n=1 Tax=Mesobacterium pallidum TaxID=2872037 RepID=UPI001EE2DD7F|nr:LytTR family DNA-binding domain-containing protein [Mesobacterium pallidum]